MLVVEGLTCRFGVKAAVDDASFQVSPGGFVGVIGRSGAGKSTLLRTINRLATPSQGCILFDGLDVTALRGKQLRQWRARSAVIFQQFNLVGRLDVLTNVLMGRLATMPAWRSLSQTWPEQDKALAMSALEQFDIAPLAAQRADQLSGGQQQRVAIARALAQQPGAPTTPPAASSSAPRSPARWCSSPTSPSPTSRSLRSIRATPRSSWMRFCASTSILASPCSAICIRSTWRAAIATA